MQLDEAASIIHKDWKANRPGMKPKAMTMARELFQTFNIPVPDYGPFLHWAKMSRVNLSQGERAKHVLMKLHPDHELPNSQPAFLQLLKGTY